MPGKAKNFTSRSDLTDKVPWKRLEDFKDHNLPRPLILINGAFDMLHSGHLKIIAQARERGATVVAAVDSDRRVRERKGPQRPIMTFVERALALNYTPIDFITEITSEEDFAQLVNLLKPDLRVQGKEYKGAKSRFPHIQKMFVNVQGVRTSNIIERILKRYE